jgi:threonine/homoserine/homoserine lactone efflux protein
MVVPDPGLYALFVVAALALLAVPGPAVLYIVSQSIEGGRRAGLVSTLGIHCGTLVHVAAAALGLSSLLVSSARAFDIVKYAGAALLAGTLAGRLRRSARASSIGRWALRRDPGRARRRRCAQQPAPLVLT